jgi:hypothetical protein
VRLFLFLAPYLVAAILISATILRFRRARRLIDVDAVNISSGVRISAVLSALLMIGVSLFILIQFSPMLWVRFAGLAGLAGGLEQLSLAAARGKSWLIWQNRVFALLFAGLSVVIVASEAL